MKLGYKTKGDAPVNGKQHIFLHAASKDRKNRDRVIDLILSSADGHRYVVFYQEDEISFDLDFGGTDLSTMVLYVPLISPEYLARCPKGFSYSAIREKGLGILPIITTPRTPPEFNERFRHVHAIKLSMKNPALEIGKQLDRLVISSDLYDEIIRDAFTRLLFISYRKKDKDEIIRIMKAVRNTRWASATAFWFDDYLVPGTDFADGIKQAMKESDAVIMAVTPNLPALNDNGQANYVARVEYRDAVDLGKKIIPIEVVPTERKALDENFEHFPKCVSVDDADGLNEELEQVGGQVPKEEPHIRYLRAMGFLNGIRAEKDTARAVAMLQDCAEKNVPEAAYQLSYMYAFGIAVPEDLKTAVGYMGRTFDIADTLEDPEEKLVWMYKAISNGGKDPGANPGLTPEENDAFYKRFLQAVEEYESGGDIGEDSDRYLLQKAEIHAFLGNTEDRKIKFDSEYELLKAKELLDKVKDKESREYLRVKASVNSFLSSYYRKKAAESNEYMKQRDAGEKALEAAREALKSQEKVLLTDTSYEARWQLAGYRNNVIGCRWLAGPKTGGIVGKDEIRQVIGELEGLHAEKENPELAVELVTAYRNLQITTQNSIRMGRYLRKARKKGELFHETFPMYPPLNQKNNEIDGQLDSLQRATTVPRVAGVIFHYLYLMTLVLGGLMLIMHGETRTTGDTLIDIAVVVGLFPAVAGVDKMKTTRHIWINVLCVVVVAAAISLILTLTGTGVIGLIPGYKLRGVVCLVLAFILLIA